jgi:hypothetical protein
MAVAKLLAIHLDGAFLTARACLYKPAGAVLSFIYMGSLP